VQLTLKKGFYLRVIEIHTCELCGEKTPTPSDEKKVTTLVGRFNMNVNDMFDTFDDRLVSKDGVHYVSMKNSDNFGRCKIKAYYDIIGDPSINDKIKSLFMSDSRIIASMGMLLSGD